MGKFSEAEALNSEDGLKADSIGEIKEAPTHQVSVSHRREPVAFESPTLTIISNSILAGIEPAKLEKIYELYAREQADLARRKYYHAMAKMQSAMTSSVKNVHVNFKSLKGDGVIDFRASNLNAIVSELRPLLDKFGFSFRFEERQSFEHQIVETTCILTHEDGHEEKSTMSGPYDYSGCKNNYQAAGSTVAYLRKLTLKAVTGMTEDDEYDEGYGASGAPKLNGEFAGGQQKTPASNGAFKKREAEKPKAVQDAMAKISPEQVRVLRRAIQNSKYDEEVVLFDNSISSLEEIPNARFNGILKSINSQKN